MELNKQTLSIRLDPDILERLREQADTEGETISVVIRRLLRKALEAA